MDLSVRGGGRRRGDPARPLRRPETTTPSPDLSRHA